VAFASTIPRVRGFIDNLFVPGNEFHTVVGVIAAFVGTLAGYVLVPCRPGSVVLSRVVRALHNFMGGPVSISVVCSS
jgi:hypothetical protein